MLDNSKTSYKSMPTFPQNTEDHGYNHGYDQGYQHGYNSGIQPSKGGSGGNVHSYGYPSYNFGHEDHNMQGNHETTISNIVTTIKNIIKQTSSEKPVEDGDILNNQDGFGAFTENTNIEKITEITKSVFPDGPNLIPNATEVLIPPVQEPGAGVVETVTDAIEITTKYVNDMVFMDSSESSQHDYDDGMMSAHHSEDYNTVYIILGVVLGILVLIGVILGFIYLYYRRRGFHDLEGDNKVTVHKAKEPSTHKIEQVAREDTWLKASKGGKK